MILIIGGISQGKEKFAKTFDHASFCNADEHQNDFYNFDIILEIDKLVSKMLSDGQWDIKSFNLDKLEGKIITGNEVGLGIVPIDKKERQLRDEVGFLYQELVKRATKVYRVWNGIPMLIKG